MIEQHNTFSLWNVGVVVCLNGSDDDEIHNNHLIISDKDSIPGCGRSGYLQNFILENVSTKESWSLPDNLEIVSG